MRPEHDDQHLDIAGNDRGNRCAVGAQPRQAQLAENQHPIEKAVDKNRNDTGRHRQDRLPGFAQRARVALHQHEGWQADQEDFDVAVTVAETPLNVFNVSLTGQKESDQRPAAEKQHGRTDHEQQKALDQLVAKGVPDAFEIAFSIELGAEDAGSGDRSKDGKIEDEDQGVGDRDAGHLHRADPADHNVVQHADEICDPVLNHDRQGNHQGGAVELPVSEKSVWPHLNLTGWRESPSDIPRFWSRIQR